MKIDFPVLNVKMVPIYKVVANDYNPNRVARPELLLLKHSIEKDGYTQPIVTYHDKKNDLYILVDGFHRYRCAKEFFDLKEIPKKIELIKGLMRTASKELDFEKAIKYREEIKDKRRRN